MAPRTKATTSTNNTTADIDYAKLANAFLDALVNRLGGSISNGTAATADVSTSESETGATDKYDTMTLKALRAELIDRGYPKSEVSSADKKSCIEALRDDDAESGEDDDREAEEETDEDEADESEDEEDEDEEEEEDDDDEEADEDEEEGFSREELEEMSLAQLKKLARETGYTTADLKGLDQDGIVDLLLGEADEEEEDEEEDEEEEIELDEDSLMAMDRKEVVAIAKEYGVTVAPRAKQADIVAAILEAVEE